MNYFTSDIHYGQRPVWKRRTHTTIEEHDEYYTEMFMKTKKKDIVFVLGDLLFPMKTQEEFDKYLELFKKIPAKIKLIPGNHFDTRLYKQDVIEILPCLVNYKAMWLSHCPIHPAEFRERILNVHGHNHIRHLKDERYFNVCIDLWDRFVTYEEILETRNKFEPKETDYELYYKKLYI